MILFELHFQVDPSKRAEFEAVYAEVFAVAISKQKGFKTLKLLRVYSPPAVAEIGASVTEYDYQINFTFESEAARRAWATSTEHDVAWPKLSALTHKFFWRGYDLLAEK
ncbi:MAG: cupin [Polyangiaceae bacterium]|jgi:heme-degrading monooxygenase HmoA|nr:cupin [Polyangiaceae bacterium]